MKANLIFYLSSQTSYCETALEKSLKNTRLEISEVAAAINPEQLGIQLTTAFSKVDTVFVIGGYTKDERDIKKVLSKALSKQKDKPKTQIIKNPLKGDNGSLAECKKQKIISLPDSPQAIEIMVDKKLTEYILKK